MAVTPEDVRMAYKLILGREASEAEIANAAKNHSSIDVVRNAFLRSQEFRKKYARMIAQADKNVPPLLIHLHIPKTAGTSLGKALEAEDRLKPSRVVHEKSVGEIASLPRAERLKLRYIRGHMVMGVGKKLDVPHRYVCLIREPGPRIYSFYQFVRRTATHPDHKLVAKRDMTFGKYLEFTQTKMNHRTEVHNGQVRRLSGVFSPPEFGDEATLLRSAIHNLLAPNVMWGIADKIGLLADELVANGYLASNDIGKKNVSPNSDMYQTAVSNLTDHQRDIFETYTEFDDQLYSLCKSLLENKSDEQARSATR